jgi:hypothetical protein
MMEASSSSGREARSRFITIFAAGGAIVLVLAVGLVMLSRSFHPDRQSVAAKLPFGPKEQAYEGRIHFQDLQLSHSTNLLNQEFTYVAGTISNDGTRTVRALEVTIEFHDPFNQVILRETEKLVQLADQALRGSEQRRFQITIEQGIPSEWNRQYPSFRVTGLTLE